MQSISDFFSDLYRGEILPPASTHAVLSLTLPLTCLSLGESAGDIGYCGGTQS